MTRANAYEALPVSEKCRGGSVDLSFDTHDVQDFLSFTSYLDEMTDTRYLLPLANNKKTMWHDGNYKKYFDQMYNLWAPKTVFVSLF